VVDKLGRGGMGIVYKAETNAFERARLFPWPRVRGGVAERTEKIVTSNLIGHSTKDRPLASGIAVPSPVAESALRLVDSAREDLESLVYYEHPLTIRGVVVVARDRVESYPDLLARIYRTLAVVPAIHCLRWRELFFLALPGSSAPPYLDEQPHLAYCVKYRSALLHGRDFRPEVPLPAQPRLFLQEHLRGCRHYFRGHYLQRLLEKAHRELVGEILAEARRLMSTALMGERGGWQIDLADVPQRFSIWRGTAEAAEVVEGLETFAQRLSDPTAALEEADAYEVVRLFERLLDLVAKGGV
jgi:HEPN domain-containing protein